MSAKLIAEDGLLKGLVLSLDQGEQWTIGRDPDECQLLVEDPEVSRKHAICRKTPEGILLENLSTSNPIILNGQELKTPTLIHEGDSIKIGNETFRYHTNADSTPLPANTVKMETADVIAQIKVEDDLSEETDTGEEELPPPAEPPPEPRAETPPTEHPSDEQPSEERPSEEHPPEEHPSEEQSPASTTAPATAQELPAPDTEPPEREPPKAPEESVEEKAIQPDTLPVKESEEPHSEAKSTELPKEEGPMTAVTEELEKTEAEEVIADIPEDTLFEDEDSSLAEINFDLQDSGRWMLKVVGGANNGAEFALHPSTTYTIGTDPNACDIVFYDTSVSRTHARISIDDHEQLFIEDLKSRNGTLVDGEPLKEKRPLETNVIVTMGTTSFVVLDREGEMHTIISPLLPSIVKVLQKEEEPKKPEEEVPQEAPLASLAPPQAREDTSAHTLNAFILISIITGLFILTGLGIATLFQSKPIEVQQITDTDKQLDEALMMFPGVKHSFNKSTGRLLLVGHVMTSVDKNQLLYNLQGLPFIKSLDDSGIVIDEFVWKEINQVLTKNPLWKGVTIHSPTAGHFVLSGYLKSRKQGEQLSDYLSSNFPYLDLLEKRVIVEEDVANAAMIQLQNKGIRDVKVEMNEGQLILTGMVEPKSLKAYDELTAEFSKIPGVRSIQNLVAERAPASAIENISDRYHVSGVSSQGKTISVVINGRILQINETIDGMTIKEITPHSIFLERDGKKFKIDF